MFQIVSHHTAGNYMKSKKANKKFDFKVFTETGPKTSLITDGTQQSKRTSLISFYELEFQEENIKKKHKIFIKLIFYIIGSR